MHRYCIMQHRFYVSNTIYQYFSWLEFKWHNDLETRHPWIWIAPVCGLVDSDFTDDTSLGHYPIRKPLIMNEVFCTFNNSCMIFRVAPLKGIPQSVPPRTPTSSTFRSPTATRFAGTPNRTPIHRKEGGIKVIHQNNKQLFYLLSSI